MLTNEILQALKGYAANMQKKVTFVLQSDPMTSATNWPASF